MQIGLPSKKGIAGFLSVAVLCMAQSAHAFKAEGHEAIEIAAYAKLQETDDGLGVLQTLLGRHLLKQRANVACVRNGEVCVEATNGDVDADLVLQTGFAGQCAHFMAAPIDDVLGPHPDYSPVMMSLAAIPRCRRYLDRKVQLALTDPTDGFDAMQALLHSLIDSYSEAHTARNPKGQTPEAWEKSSILRLKVWDLLGFYYRGTTHNEASNYHALSDCRDDGYRYLREACEATRHPTKPLAGECMTPLGKGAVLATIELLRTVAELVKKHDAVVWNDPKWLQFLDSHVRPDSSVRSIDVEAINRRQLAAGGRPWDFQPAVIGDGFDCRAPDASKVYDPRCERDAERLIYSDTWLSLIGRTGDYSRAGRSSRVSLEFRHYPSITSVNRRLASVLPLKWSPFVSIEAGASTVSDVFFRGNVGTVSIVPHPNLALSFVNMNATVSCNDPKPMFGMQAAELSLRLRKVQLSAGILGWRFGRNEAYPSFSLSVGYGVTSREL